VRRIIAPLALALAVAAPTTASAAVAHTVVPGETLWSIASANNLTNRALAAYNHLDPEGNVILGSTVMIPSPSEAAAAMAAAGMTPTNPGPSGTATTTPAAGTTSSTTAAAPPPMGAYTVRWGDTLSGLAATARVPLSSIAAMNGLDPNGTLLAGTVLKLPTGSPTPALAAQPAPTPVVPQAAPEPTPARLDSGTIASIASQNGVPGSLAAALAWQESGFNNDMVSPANARGVMQVMPGTWSWIQQNLATRPLDPASAADNVQAGSMYLGSLLKATGGDQATAIAAYYQGLSSVQQHGMLPETRQYVANVQALEHRFGG
jgi:soluble lytic murein transglycosylase-like protein